MNIQEGIFWLVLTVFLEGRDQPIKGQKDIVKVILNRAEKKQWPLENIIFAKKQFSCYNKGLLKAFESVAREFQYIKVVTNNVQVAVTEWQKGDRLYGATHYYASSGPNKIPPPYWVSSMKFIGKWGDHSFLRDG